ncbi:MAG: hypothetical protein ACJ75R_10645 [Solirubrobacterales bacterium]
MTLRRALPIVFALAGLLVPAAAHAASKYKLTYSGSGSYRVDLVSPTGEQGHVSADFDWHIAYRKVAIDSGKGLPWNRGRASGGGTWKMTSEADQCSRTGDLKLIGDGGGFGDVRRGQVIVFPEEGDYSSTDPGNVGSPCDTSDFWRQWVADFSQVGQADGVDPLTSFFQVKPSKLKHAKSITVKTSNRAPQFPSLSPAPNCGFTGIGSCTQSFSWTATVKIRRRG